MRESEAAMSQGQDWNTPGAPQGYQPPPAGQGYQQPPAGQGYQQPQYGQAYQQPPAGQAYPQAGMVPAAAYGAPGMAPAVHIPPGFYYDQLSGLILPNGTALAPVGRRIGAYFLGILLSFVTLGIGYLIWGAISWSHGQSPVQQVLGLQVWKPQERVNATWGTMFLRGLGYVIINVIPFGQIVSFFLFVSGKEHRALHDSMSGTVVLHDPNKVLQPTPVR
jgi:uncharacterized RDD family membrane protein YckC